jgi:hypothetical protein
MAASAVWLGAGGGAAAIARQLSHWARTAEGLRFIGVFAAALTIRLALGPDVMLTGDLNAYAYWGGLALHHFFDAYSVGSMNPSWVLWPAYPPLAFYVFGPIEVVYFATAHVLGIQAPHDPVVSPALRLVLRLPEIFAELDLLTLI